MIGNVTKTQRRRRARLAMVVGVVLGIVGLVLVGAGGLGVTLAGDGGYVVLGHARYQGSGYAVITDAYDWADANLVGAQYGQVRVQVTPTGAGPVFIGVAPAGAVRHYLRDVAYSTASPAGSQRVHYTAHQGSAPAVTPADAGIWLASSTGSGTRTFQFDAHATPGDLVLVAMNADGTASVGGTVRTSTTMPGLNGISGATLAAGVLAIGAGAVVLVRRRRRVVRLGP